MFERGGGLEYRYADLARDLGVSQNTTSAWRNGEKISRDNIRKLAIHFQTTSRHIYGLLGETPPPGLNDADEILAGLINMIPPEARNSDQLKAVLKNWGTLTDAKRQAIMQLSARGDDPGQATPKPVGKPARKHTG